MTGSYLFHGSMTAPSNPTRIYVDADACPVKDEIYCVAARHGLPVSVVANGYIRVPQDPLIERIDAGAKPDAADDWIAERAGPTDIVITADIPLASRCVKAGCEVIAIVKHEGQLEAARQLGAAHVVQASTIRKAIQEARALTPRGQGVDIAIEAVGIPETWQEAVELVRKGGTVNFFGGCAVGTHVTLDTNRLHYSDITLRATFHHTPAICRRALDLIAGGHFQADKFITGHAHLYELNRVFENLMNRSSEIKTAIVP